MSTTPVKDPNEELQTRVSKLKSKATRTKRRLLLAAKVEKAKEKTYGHLAKMQKLQEKMDNATKTATT